MIDESEFQMGMRRLERILHDGVQTVDADPEVRMNVCKMCNHVWRSRGDSTPKHCPACRSTLWDSDEARTVRCYRCGHTWTTTRADIVRCPACRSKKWDRETVMLVCRRCGSRWEDTVRDGAEVSCPECGVLSRSDYRAASKEKETLATVSKPHRDSALSEDALRSMWEEDGDLVRSMYLRNLGMSAEQADVIVQFDGGMTATEIACRMSMPVCDVMRIVLPYMELCESMGVRSWS